METTKKELKTFKGGNPNNVLVIGDLHSPWILDGYLEFCREQQEKYDCGTVVFIGDIIDGAAWNFHEKNVDGMGVREELYAAKEQLKEWFRVFPKAYCLYGNHDLLIIRKMKAAGLSEEFMKDFAEIVGAPEGWTFLHELELNDVKYIHGSVGDAFKRAKESRISTVQGHLHTRSFVEWSVSEKDSIFGLQVGCGIDHKAYAFDYARPFPKKPVISCGIVLENGTLPIVKLMKL